MKVPFLTLVPSSASSSSMSKLSSRFLLFLQHPVQQLQIKSTKWKHKRRRRLRGFQQCSKWDGWSMGRFRQWGGWGGGGRREWGDRNTVHGDNEERRSRFQVFQTIWTESSIWYAWHKNANLGQNSTHQHLVILIRSEFDGEFGGEDHVADPEGWGGIPTCPDLNAPLLVWLWHWWRSLRNHYFQKKFEIGRWFTGCYIDGKN